MKCYLVTGAAGFIGSALAKKLIDQGHEVWTIDNLSTGYRENIPSGVVFIEGACQESSVIKKLKSKKFDAILHFAGQSSGEISFDDPVYDLRTNTESTLRLINYGLEYGCPRFIYASSMSVYGVVEDNPISEEHATSPLSFYGVGKLASENYIRIYQSKGLVPTTLRIFNVYGPGQNMRNMRQGMISIYLQQLLQNESIIVKGALDRYRDFIYIDDCIAFIMHVINNEKSCGRTYNVGTGIQTTVKELLDKLMMIAGVKKTIELKQGTPGDQKGIFADISTAQKELGYEPRYNLDEGLDKMITWAKLRSS